MSAGHGHKRPNLRHPKELAKLLSTGGAPELMQRWQKLDPDHDVPDLAGYNVAGTVRFIDRDAFRALIDPEYAKHILGEEIDTGITPEQTIQCLVEHESDEKTILDGANPIDSYEGAHEMATAGEHEKVRQFGGSPIKYERGLKKIIAYCEKKVPQNPPHDLACAPYLDDPDSNDKRVLKAMQAKGVHDAFKTSKRILDYSHATGPDQCIACTNWQGDRHHDLSLCRIADGLVRRDRWCKSFKPVEGHDAQAVQTRGPQGQAAPGNGNPGGPENPSGQAGGGDPLA